MQAQVFEMTGFDRIIPDIHHNLGGRPETDIVILVLFGHGIALVDNITNIIGPVGR